MSKLGWGLLALLFMIGAGIVLHLTRGTAREGCDMSIPVLAARNPACVR